MLYSPLSDTRKRNCGEVEPEAGLPRFGDRPPRHPDDAGQPAAGAQPASAYNPGVAATAESGAAHARSGAPTAVSEAASRCAEAGSGPDAAALAGAEGPDQHRRALGCPAEAARPAPRRGPGDAEGPAGRGAERPALGAADPDEPQRAGHPDRAFLGAGDRGPGHTGRTGAGGPVHRRLPAEPGAPDGGLGPAGTAHGHRPADGAALLRSGGGGLHGLDEPVQERGLPELDRAAAGAHGLP